MSAKASKESFYDEGLGNCMKCLLQISIKIEKWWLKILQMKLIADFPWQKQFPGSWMRYHVGISTRVISEKNGMRGFGDREDKHAL